MGVNELIRIPAYQHEISIAFVADVVDESNLCSVIIDGQELPTSAIFRWPLFGF